MHFDLSAALTSDILFSMEDQGGCFLLDTEAGVIINAEIDGVSDAGDDGRYIPLPEWSPSNGYRLMEHFTAGLRNSEVREKLSSALNGGKGVFRSFKNVLAHYPETEKRWFACKELEMKREVLIWYNALRESWGMELTGGEPDEADDLVLEDFTIRPGAAADGEAAAALHRLCLENAPEASRAGMSPWKFPGDASFVAETAAGEFAGCISAVRGEYSALCISALEVAPRYRGLGLAITLLRRLCDAARLVASGSGISRIIVDLPAESGVFSRALVRESFTPQVQRYCRELN